MGARISGVRTERGTSVTHHTLLRVKRSVALILYTLFRWKDDGLRYEYKLTLISMLIHIWIKLLLSSSLDVTSLWCLFLFVCLFFVFVFVLFCFLFCFCLFVYFLHVR